MNCMTIYTGAISLQQMSTKLTLIPRFVWTLAFFVLILSTGIAGHEQLLPLLENLSATLGYFNTAFFVILFVEHYLFRGGQIANYDLDAWNDPSRLPVGWAGGVAFVVGSLASAAGMDESWFIGPLAKVAGGDVGNIFAGVVAAVLFVPLRIWEKRAVGR